MPSRLRSIYVVSLGCAKNRVDSEVLAGIAQERGLVVTYTPDRADVILVNTCAFIESAKEESVEVVLEMARFARESCGLLVVAGCMAQRYSEVLARELPEVDHLLGTSELGGLKQILDGAAKRILVSEEASHFLPSSETPRFVEPGAASAFVKIADGCSRRCAFCAIPGIRGRARSRPLDDIAKEAEQLVRSGIKELNLVAQDTSAYGRDCGDGTNLVALIEALDAVSGIRWIRLLYLYPDSVSDRLIEAIGASRRVVPYFDIPIQHAATSMLKRMRRGHGKRELRQLIGRIRSRIPEAFLRTAVLVGHPGESQREFEELLDLIEWACFDHLGAFRYSAEEETASYDMKGAVPARDAYNRLRRVMALQRRVGRAKRRALEGRELEVLVEDIADEQGYLLVGRHAGQAPEVDGATYLVSSTAKPRDLIQARVVKTGDYDVVAEQI
jgi:ribosomal protein S12 methylthiotransferase